MGWSKLSSRIRGSKLLKAFQATTVVVGYGWWSSHWPGNLTIRGWFVATDDPSALEISSHLCQVFLQGDPDAEIARSFE